MILSSWILLAAWTLCTAGAVLFSAASIDLFVLKVAAANLLPHAAAALFLWRGRASRQTVAVLAAGIALSFIITAAALANAFLLQPDAQGAFVFMALPFLCAAPVLLAGGAALLLRRFGKTSSTAER